MSGWNIKPPAILFTDATYQIHNWYLVHSKFYPLYCFWEMLIESKLKLYIMVNGKYFKNCQLTQNSMKSSLILHTNHFNYLEKYRWSMQKYNTTTFPKSFPRVSQKQEKQKLLPTEQSVKLIFTRLYVLITSFGLQWDASKSPFGKDSL